MTNRTNIKRALRDCAISKEKINDIISRIESFGGEGIAVIIQDGEIQIRGNYKMDVRVLNCDKLDLSRDDVEARREELEEEYSENLKEIFV